MLHLKEESVELQSRAVDKIDAIQKVGDLLVRNGNILPGYVDSMIGRESVANTYLGNGIAIPHGLPKDRELIRETGICILQIPEGVSWNAGETVTLVVGIAAKSDEHIEVLANLTRVLDDPATIRELTKTTNPYDIIARLAPGQPAEKTVEVMEPDFPKYVDLVITGKSGLHARPATNFVKEAKAFESEIRIRHQNKMANGKSMISLLQLAVECGQTIRVMARGGDEDAALRALKAAVETGLGEEEEQLVSDIPSDWVLPLQTRPIPGIVASPGLAIAPVYQFKHGRIIVESTAKDPDAETTKLKQAMEAGKMELEELYQDVKIRSGAGRAEIFLAHKEFLEDPESWNGSVELIRKGHSAGWSWQQTCEQRAGALEKIEDPLLAARATDLRDVGRRVLRLLADKLEEAPQMPKKAFILIAEDLTPSDTANLDPALTVGFCTSAGGPTSHSAIIARSLDIPAIVGAGPAILNLENDTLCILDGQAGNIYPNPIESDITVAWKAQEHLREVRKAQKHACYQPAVMADGRRVEVVANIGSAAEAQQAVDAGAEGVGLMRTEFLFLNRSEPPSEEEQFETYSQTLNALNGLPLIIRTLDIGGDKEVAYLHLPREENPFLGVRGIRLCFVRRDLFEAQLRAIYRASKRGLVKIMFPMISTLEDLEQAKAIADTVRLSVGADPVGIGIMVEVPSAVLMATEFASEVEFFSIGTNDLTQYTLAMDRGHPVLAKQADGLHPAVLRMIDQTVRAARAAGKWVGVCGGIAGDPRGVEILAGLGVAELSVSIPSIAAVKARIRQLTQKQTQDLAKRALACRNAKEVRELK